MESHWSCQAENHRSLSDIALYTLEDASKRNSYVINIMLFPILITFIWIMWLFITHYNFKCGDTSLRSVHMGYLTRGRAIDDVEGVDEKYDNDIGNKEMMTVIRNITILVHGYAIDQGGTRGCK